MIEGSGTQQQVADILARNTYNDEFRFIVLVDRSDRFRAYMDSLTASELFSCRSTNMKAALATPGPTRP